MGGPQKESASENRGQLGGDGALQAEMSPAQPQPPGLQLLFLPSQGTTLDSGTSASRGGVRLRSLQPLPARVLPCKVAHRTS